MKRVAIFAHYDSNNKILDYVVEYLKELNNFVDKIIFVSDSDLSQVELNKISKYIFHSITQRHEEYDFGSYKRGFIFLKEQGWLSDYDELILANDSCYAPIFSFDNLFDKMSQKNVDFWGITANYSRIQHVQSYFLALKPNVFNSKVFEEFICSVTKEQSKGAIVKKYEVGLCEILVANNYKYDVYCESTKNHYSIEVDRFDKLIKKEKCPFLKRKIVLFKDYKRKYPLFVESLIKKYTDYDYNLIKQDLIANGNRLTFWQHFTGFLFALRKRVFKFKGNKRCFMLFGIWFDYSIFFSNKDIN